MLAGAQALPLALPTKHGRPLCILKSEEHFSSISVEAIRELPFLSDEGAENVLVLILDEEDRGVVAFGLLEEGGVTLAVFVQFVEALPVADAGVAWELRDEVVEHGLGQDFTLAADVLRSVALASWVLNLLFAVALVRFHCSLGQLAFRAKLLKLRCIINVSTFKLERWKLVRETPLIQYGSFSEWQPAVRSFAAERLLLPMASRDGKVDTVLGLALYDISLPDPSRPPPFARNLIRVRCDEI